MKTNQMTEQINSNIFNLKTILENLSEDYVSPTIKSRDDMVKIIGYDDFPLEDWEEEMEEL